MFSIINIVIAVAVLALIVHGLVHLMGTAVYLKRATIRGLTYKTVLFGGRLDVGEGGIRVFGALWAVAAIGFIAVAVALPLGLDWWRPVLMGTTILSLVLTFLDWSDAFAGTIIDMAILAAVVAEPFVVRCLVR